MEGLLYIAARVAVGDGNVVRAALMVAEGELVPSAARACGASKWQVRKLYDTLRAMAVLDAPPPRELHAWLDALEAAAERLGFRPRGEGVCPFCLAQVEPKRSLVFHVFSQHRDLLERLVREAGPPAALARTATRGSAPR